MAVLVRALRAYVTGDYAGAAELISRRTGEWVRLGGSDAQREVIDDTLLSALRHTGRYAIPSVHQELAGRRATVRP